MSRSAGYDPNRHLLRTPVDTEAPRRAARLRELGIGDAPVPAFDTYAHEVARALRAPYGVVNLLDEDRQYLAGLYTPPRGRVPGAPRARGGDLRVIARDHGYCPHVVVRRKALVLEDVRDYPRFAGNPVVDESGIRAYLGAPLIDRTGLALGTVCVVDLEPRRWGREGLETIKKAATDLVARIHRREDGLSDTF
ncbi:GAF domain-containing protein [Streptomyces sp. NBC_01525]|uniref:GAF domain-containing protein n=1 Tax=Streptomyces TaxID=1883 RepID=UPI002035A1CD|nr:GAF domain-containing protein [Streptomyces benahoarensis]